MSFNSCVGKSPAVSVMPIPVLFQLPLTVIAPKLRSSLVRIGWPRIIGATFAPAMPLTSPVMMPVPERVPLELMTMPSAATSVVPE